LDVPRITKVYTRTGDDGTTALGTGQRVPKTARRIQAYGTVDELNAQIGIVLISGLAAELIEPLRRIQNELFHLGAELSVPEADKAKRPGPQIGSRHVEALEQLMDHLSARLEPLKNFVLPGGAPAAAQLHVARTVCRRAEREVVALAEQEPVGPHAIQYLNRLSDALFVLGRYQNKLSGVDELSWDSRA
jgi:cob(I)alamin adenosyltransferase